MIAAVLLVAGCGAESGHAEKLQNAPTPAGVDTNLLGSGNFPVKPMPPLGVAGSAAQGALIDARRMADDVAGP
jgi:hypothetical protein